MSSGSSWATHLNTSSNHPNCGQNMKPEEGPARYHSTRVNMKGPPKRRGYDRSHHTKLTGLQYGCHPGGSKQGSGLSRLHWTTQVVLYGTRADDTSLLQDLRRACKRCMTHPGLQTSRVRPAPMEHNGAATLSKGRWSPQSWAQKYEFKEASSSNST